MLQPEHTRGGKEADQESLVERNEERDGESSDGQRAFGVSSMEP